MLRGGSRWALLGLLVALATAFPFTAGLGIAPDSAAATLAAPICDTPKGPTQLTPMDAFETIRRAYENEPGFVDVYVYHEPTPLILVLFDLDRRGGEPLPAAMPAPAGFELHVEGTTFEELIAPPNAYESPPLLGEECTSRIGPGARASTPVGGCTMNFIFQATNGQKYVGTAGHCFSALGQRMSTDGLGEVGTVIYRIANGVGNDFALVSIDPEDLGSVNPAMCHWGGPTAEGNSGEDVVRHYGWPVFYSATALTRARTGLFASVTGNSFEFAGTVASGDSGSGARVDSGPSLGAITHVDVGLIFFAHSLPSAFGTTVPRAIQLAESGTGLQLSLLTAPVT